MTIRIKFDGRNSSKAVFKQRVNKFSERQIKAVQAAAYRAADEIEFAGREDIRAGGDFGSARWIDGFRAKVSYISRSNLRIRVTHAVSYWRVFEYGKRIMGRPLLWIPLDFGNAFGVRARDYPGKLFRVDRKNGKAPLLLDKNGPQYFGKTSVKIPKKWHLRRITSTVKRKLKRFYREAMKNG